MLLGRTVQIIVAEPWDFTSPEGDNKFSGQIIQSISKDVGTINLIKIYSPFAINNLIVKYVVTVPRQRIDTTQINIYHVPEDIIRMDNFWELLESNTSFIAIGSI